MSLITTFIVAVSLSMDAFSLSLIYGTYKINNKDSLLISLIVGIFHFFMPLLGFNFGDLLSKLLTFNYNFFMGLIFIYLGIQMLISIYKKDKIEMINNILSYILFAFTVSIDSFTIGVGFGLNNNNNYLNYFIFSIISFLFTYFGLKLGNYLSNKFGIYSNIIGSVILILLGLSYL